MTPYDLMERFVGMREMAGAKDHPFIVWCLSLCGLSDAHDEVPWCSAFLNGICWLLRLPRSKSAAARSWLAVGRPIALEEARPGFDVVVLWRGTAPQPGAHVLNAPGHVGLFARLEGNDVLILAGNQGDAVSVARFPKVRVLGVRRLAAA